MKQVVRTVDVLYPGKGIKTYSGEEMEFGYRTSRFKREDGIVLAASIELTPGDKKVITDRITELAQQRKDKQPLEYASAGSTFKRPEGYFAGKLIQDAGLKGFRVGDAQVSEKHAGFVINRGNASAAQIRKLIEEVQRIVLEDSGVRLEREVIFLGEF
jgi:UDP-N-acetylmuramate dehydrogenase